MSVERVSYQNSISPSRSPLASGRTSRKNSVASLGEHFTSLLSLSHALQVLFLCVLCFLVVVWCYGVVILWYCGVLVLCYGGEPCEAHHQSTQPLTCSSGFAVLCIAVYYAIVLFLYFGLVSLSHTLPVLFYCVVCYLWVLYCIELGCCFTVLLW